MTVALLTPPARQVLPNGASNARLDGPQVFERYSFMPNQLGYCGADDPGALFDYAVAGMTDTGLRLLLGSFQGAVPYMKLIAQGNLIADPFDRRVVEAYWIGNDLLNHVEARALHASLQARFARQMSQKTLELVLGKAPAGARPHHSFHVIEVCPRNGWPQALGYMDNCRISWGQVQGVVGAELRTATPPLILQDGQLTLAAPVMRQVLRQIDGRGFTDHVQPGDWISIHWGWACQVLTAAQVRQLEYWTQYHLRLANQTL
ncbi:MAG: DUF6390 family protein [Anaerolineae bacterium]